MLHWSSVRTVVEPSVEPVSVAEAKSWLRIDSSDEDTLIAGLITMARRQVERMTGRALVEQTVEFKASRFDHCLYLTRAPILQILAVEYLDADGDLQTVDPDDYVVIQSDERPSIEPAPGKSWPSIICQPNAVTVAASCGYGDASDVPADLKHAIAIMVADAYANREGQASSARTIEALISTYKTNLVG